MSEKQTVYQRLAENLKDKPNHQIIDLAGEKILVKDFLKNIETTAKGIDLLGVQKGNKITVLD